MSNSFASVQNLNNYTDMSSSSAEIISLSVNTFTNGPLTYYNVVGYAPTSFATLASGTAVSLSSVNGVSETTVDNALVIPVGAYITSIIVTNNGIPIIPGAATSLTLYTSETINDIDPYIQSIGTDLLFNVINYIGYSGAVFEYVAYLNLLYVNIYPNGTLTTGSLCVYITYVMATNSAPRYPF